MAVTAEDLRKEVNTTSTAETAVLTQCLDVATELLRQYVGTEYPNIPGKVYDRALTAVAVDLFNQRKAPNGVLNQQYVTADGDVGGAALRISSDPLRPARPLLEQWVIAVGFA